MAKTNLLEGVEYYNWVKNELSNNKNGDNNVDLFNYTAGMSEESGEILEVINSFTSHSALLKKPEKFVEESGDFLWYAVAYHCLTTNGDYNDFLLLVSQYNDEIPSFMEIESLVRDCLKLQGLYRKKIFLAKNVSSEEINSLYTICFMRFIAIVRYFGYSLQEISHSNKEKLNIRYPNGRNSSFYIELNFNKK